MIFVPDGLIGRYAGISNKIQASTLPRRLQIEHQPGSTRPPLTSMGFSELYSGLQTNFSVVARLGWPAGRIPEAYFRGLLGDPGNPRRKHGLLFLNVHCPAHPNSVANP